MEDDAARFKRELEKRTGEKVVAVAVASVEPEGVERNAVWGVVVLTDSALRFLHQPSQHWLSSLTLSHDRTSPPALPPEMVIPLGDDASFTIPNRGAIARIFSPPFSSLAVSWNKDGQPRSATFSLDPKSALFSALGIDPRKRPERQAR